MAGHFRHRALFVGPNARRPSPRAAPTTCRPSCPTSRACSRPGPCPLDAVLVNVTPPDAHGFCSLGVSVEAMHAAIGAATTVIAQLNRAMPRTLGESFIHVDDIDLAVEVDMPPVRAPVAPIGDVERRIGEYVAELVPDGATIQLGIGAIPAATALALRDRRDLGRPHRDVHRQRRRPGRGRRRSPGARKERNRGQDRDRVPDGHAPAVRLRRRQPDDRDAHRSTSPTTRTSSARSAG